jgi:hypothetical protein
MFRIGCGHHHVSGCRSKRERLGGQYHINIQVFDVSGWSPSLAARLPPTGALRLKAEDIDRAFAEVNVSSRETLKVLFARSNSRLSS